MAAKLPEVQITLLVFVDTHVILQTIQRFMTMYETSKSPAIMVHSTLCQKSKMAAN